MIYIFVNCANSYRKIVEFKDFSRLLSDFPVLLKADLIFKESSRKPSKFQVLFKNVPTLVPSTVYIIWHTFAKFEVAPSTG